MISGMDMHLKNSSCVKTIIPLSGTTGSRSIEEASKISGLGIDAIKKFIELEVIIPVENNSGNIKLNSFSITRLKKISELLDKDLSKAEIIKELDK